ncbi:hypothetical protein [Patulibacter sp.]|uniref:hypothetical protein n=1 Tax=Patulibacter sp. TaxID=1912859 RepID=UPI00271AA778|nr:hypothetical protein [Patulibacter sp.]MDO9409981.1 hypothetical protein [Patulibacter sp.]
MPPYVLRHPALVVGVVAAMGVGTVAPAVASAATPPPAVQQTQDLSGLIGGLLGGVTSTVGGIVDQLVAGTLPGVLPANTISTLINTLVGAPVTAVTEILDLLSPDQILQIVSKGPVAATTQLLQGVLASVTKLTTTLAAGTAQLPLVGDTFDRLTAVLAGGIPTAADALKTFTAILDQVTTQLGLPKVADLPAVGPLLQKLVALVGQVSDPAAVAAITRTLTAAAKAYGIDPAAALAALGTAGTAVAAAPAAAVTVARARLNAASVGATRRTVKLRVICPTTAPATGCVVSPSFKLGSTSAKLGRSVTVARGTTRSITAALPSSVAKKLRKAGGKLVVTMKTTGATAGAVKKTLTVPAG